MKKIETVAIIGLGAIGCTIVPYLSKVLDLENLRIIAGGSRKERLEQKGIMINDTIYKLNVISPDTACKPADLVIVAVKYNQLEQAIKDIKNQVGPDTLILSLMNGITSEDEIGGAYGMDKVLYSYTAMNASYKDGVAAFSAGNNKIKFGEPNNKTYSERVLAIKELFDACGIPYEIPENMIRDLWLKYLLNVSGNPVAGILRAKHVLFQKLDSANNARECIAKEVIALSKAMGTGLTDEDLIHMRTIYYNYSPEGRGSMVQDILAGRQTENEMFCGTVIRLGKKYNIPTPANELLYYLVQTIDAENAGALNS